MRQQPRASTFRIYLHCPAISLAVDTVLADPTLSALAVDDACWVAARDDWADRKPRVWQRRRLSRWRAEWRQLGEQRQQLRAVAQACGLRLR